AKRNRRLDMAINARAAGSNFIHINRDKESFMSASVITFPQTERMTSTSIVTVGDRCAAVAAERAGRNVKEIERLPFDLSVLEEEGLFVNVDATGFGILDRRLDWQALGVELPAETDVAFRPPRCGLLPNRYRRQLLTPVSQSHAALHKYSYHFRLTETLFETPAYRWVPWQAFTEFETVFNGACDNLNKAKQTVLEAYDEIRGEVVAAFNQVAADSALRLAATKATVPSDFEDRLIDWALNAFPTRDELRNKLTLRFQVGVILLGSEILRHLCYRDAHELAQPNRLAALEL